MQARGNGSLNFIIAALRIRRGLLSFGWLGLRIMFLVVPLHASGQSATVKKNPFAGTDKFPEFRDFSALSGSTYGVDSDGFTSLSGPTAFSTPIAHVLGRGQFRIGGGATSFSSSPAVNQTDSDGTFFATYGHTIGRVNAAVSIMVLSQDLNFALNGQVQYVPSRSSRWVASAGVQDWRGHGGSSGDQVAGDNRTSTSVFGVVTYRADTPRAPVYLSAGIGFRRFSNGFGSISYQVAKPVRVWVEHDGFGVNEGILLTWRQRDSHRSPEFNALIGLVKGRYFTIGGGLGF